MAGKMDYQNRKNLLLYLLDFGSATKLELVQKTKLSNTTVSDTVNSLLKKGFLNIVGMNPSIGGRPSAIYSINKEYGQFIGLDIRQNQIKASLCDASGHKIRFMSIERLSNELSIMMLYRALEQMMKLVEARRILAVGIGINATIDYQAQMVESSQDMGWYNVPLKELVERQFYLPTYIDNTINGQVPYRKYCEGENCPRHFMAVQEEFEGKATICLDGRICRGKGNLCGRIPSFEHILQSSEEAIQMLGLEMVWIACSTDAQLEKLKQEIHGSFVGHIHPYHANPSELAWGMALEAETKWFGSIYFNL